jgi:hypothetical protein
MEDSSTAIDREEKGNQYKNPSCQIGLMSSSPKFELNNFFKRWKM